MQSISHLASPGRTNRQPDWCQQRTDAMTGLFQIYGLATVRQSGIAGLFLERLGALVAGPIPSKIEEMNDSFSTSERSTSDEMIYQDLNSKITAPAPARAALGPS